MRIIHEIRGKRPQGTVSVHPYTGLAREAPAWKGARAEVLIVDCEGDTLDTFKEGDAIYIEGDLDGIRHALQLALRLLDTHEHHARKQVEDRAARAKVCERCGMYYVPHDPASEWHGDGKGNRCPPEAA